MFFDAAELEVHALALAPNGGLYVGTSPDGKIYRVDAKGTSTVYFDPEDKYIWSVVTDAAGVLYAATGEKGVIYRITAEGKGEPFYKTKATHALSLLLDRNGDLLAGTEAPGKVFRIKKDGSGFLLLDSGLQEISALRLDDKGVVYASAFSGKPAETRGTSGSARARGADAAAGALGIDRDHLDRHRRRVGCEQHERCVAARVARAPQGAARGRVPHHARRRLGHGVVAVRRCAVRPAAGERRHAARGDRKQGQDLPAHG